MESASPYPRTWLLRLLLVASIAVSHCCLLGHSVWAAGLHGDGPMAHGMAGQAASADWTPVPGSPMVCGGAHGVATARLAVPSPGPAVVPVAACAAALGGPARWTVPAYRDPPDPLPPSRARLQTYLI